MNARSQGELVAIAWPRLARRLSIRLDSRLAQPPKRQDPVIRAGVHGGASRLHTIERRQTPKIDAGRRIMEDLTQLVGRCLSRSSGSVSIAPASISSCAFGIVVSGEEPAFETTRLSSVYGSYERAPGEVAQWRGLGILPGGVERCRSRPAPTPTSIPTAASCPPIGADEVLALARRVRQPGAEPVRVTGVSQELLRQLRIVGVRRQVFVESEPSGTKRLASRAPLSPSRLATIASTSMAWLMRQPHLRVVERRHVGWDAHEGASRDRLRHDFSGCRDRSRVHQTARRARADWCRRRHRSRGSCASGTKRNATLCAIGSPWRAPHEVVVVACRAGSASRVPSAQSGTARCRPDSAAKSLAGSPAYFGGRIASHGAICEGSQGAGDG